jgi:hypothetical protein
MIDDDLAELDMRIEKFTEGSILRAFPDALLNEGDQIYIRKTGGRLQWIKANVHGGGESWQELTPVTVKHSSTASETQAIYGELAMESYKKRQQAEAEAEKETPAIGWYQDVKGDLYQYNGSEWVGIVPTKNQIAGLEYLG